MIRRITCLIACGIVVCMSGLNVAAAEPEAISELLKVLSMSGYPSPLHPPEFNGFTVNNKKISLADLRGRVVLLNFWATWCLECRSEMPMFEQLHRQFSPQGLAVIGINARERTPSIRQYAEEHRLSFPLISDPTGKINSDYGVIGLPTTFLIRRNGRALALAIGPREWNGSPARSLIATVLAESAQLRGSR